MQKTMMWPVYLIIPSIFGKRAERLVYHGWRFIVMVIYCKKKDFFKKISSLYMQLAVRRHAARCKKI